MELVTLDKAKLYLRQDTDAEDETITDLIASANRQVEAILRKPIADVEPEGQDVVRTAILYATAYLYENREKADHRDLDITLAALLFGEREEAF